MNQLTQEQIKQEDHFWAIVRAIIDFKDSTGEFETTMTERLFMEERFNLLDPAVQIKITEDMEQARQEQFAQEFGNIQISEEGQQEQNELNFFPVMPTQEDMDLDNFDQIIRDFKPRNR